MAVAKMTCGGASRAARDSLDLQGEPGSALRKSGVGPGFRSSVTRFRRFVAWIERSEIRATKVRLRRHSRVSLRSTRATKKLKEAERRQTLILILRILRCGSRLLGAFICRRSTTALT